MQTDSVAHIAKFLSVRDKFALFSVSRNLYCTRQELHFNCDTLQNCIRAVCERCENFNIVFYSYTALVNYIVALVQCYDQRVIINCERADKAFWKLNLRNHDIKHSSYPQSNARVRLLDSRKIYKTEHACMQIKIQDNTAYINKFAEHTRNWRINIEAFTEPVRIVRDIIASDHGSALVFITQRPRSDLHCMTFAAAENIGNLLVDVVVDARKRVDIAVRCVKSLPQTRKFLLVKNDLQEIEARVRMLELRYDSKACRALVLLQPVDDVELVRIYDYIVQN